MDIVFFSFADPDKLADYAKARTPVAVHNHELVAQHYELPSINLAKEVYDKIQAGEFSWQYDFKNLRPAPYGQELYFETMKSMLRACFDQEETKSKSLGKDKLSKPLDKHNFNNGTYYPIQNARILSGWKLMPDWFPQYQVSTREGFVHVPVLEGKAPGDELSLSFSGTAVGMAVVSGRMQELWNIVLIEATFKN